MWDELPAGEDGLPALESLRSRGKLVVDRIENRDLFVEFSTDLDVGEAAAITYAVEKDADLVLLDEREGRNAARRHDLSVTGVVGVLLRGSEAGTVDVEAELDRLMDAGFWLSDALYEQILDRIDTDGSDEA